MADGTLPFLKHSGNVHNSILANIVISVLIQQRKKANWHSKQQTTKDRHSLEYIIFWRKNKYVIIAVLFILNARRKKNTLLRGMVIGVHNKLYTPSLSLFLRLVLCLVRRTSISSIMMLNKQALVLILYAHVKQQTPLPYLYSNSAYH